MINRRMFQVLQRRVSDYYTDGIYYYPSPPPEHDLDEYGQPTVFPEPVYIKCSFTDKPSRENWASYADVSEIIAEVRWSDSVIPTKGSKVKIVKRFYLPCEEMTFEIVGIMSRGIFGYVCALKAIQI